MSKINKFKAGDIVVKIHSNSCDGYIGVGCKCKFVGNNNYLPFSGKYEKNIAYGTGTQISWNDDERDFALLDVKKSKSIGKHTKFSNVAKYLEVVSSITSWEAIEKFNVTRLSAIIHLLRKQGWVINGVSEHNDVTGTRFKRYIYVGKK
jgi:hypothetical protein